MSNKPIIEIPRTRRDFLTRSGTGFGAVALAGLMSKANAANPTQPTPVSVNPLAAKPGHFEAKAKSVIFLFMEGGPSHIDLLDPKPLLNKLAGKPLPDSFGSVITAMGESRSALARIETQVEAIRRGRNMGFRLVTAPRRMCG